MPYKQVSLSADFFEHIKEFINTHKELGYATVPEFLRESARLRLQEIRRELRLEYEAAATDL
ncbi:MAG: hypothetical protein ACE5OZ_22405 [Candidatus Heimdallarchaeota archaeon]